MSSKARIVGYLIGMCALPLTSPPSQAAKPLAVERPSGGFEELRRLMVAAKKHAPDVSLAAASLTASRAARENARLAAFGNPYLELTAEKGDRNVTRDVAVNGALWIPIELSGQGRSRGREAEAFVSFHVALLEQARARAAAKVVRAYGATVIAQRRAVVLADLLQDARAEARLIAERLRSGDAIQPDASLAAVEAARHEVLFVEARGELARAQGELAESLGGDAPELRGTAVPPVLPTQTGARNHATPRSLSLAAEARFHASSAERWRREGRSLFNVGVVAGRGDYGETRLGGGFAYAFPVFRSNRPESARAEAASARALAEKSVHETVEMNRLRRLQQEQQQLTTALSVLTTTALPAAEDAVRAVRETYAAGKAELLSVLLSRRELSALSLRRLELLEQSWLLVGDYVEITGDLP
jgi:outer membrane protein TolC